MSQIPTITPNPLPKRPPLCEKCNAKLRAGQGWCGRCGWYPRLEIFLELEPWDREPSPSEKTEKKKAPLLRAWHKLVPLWCWKLMGGMVGIALISVAARMLLPRHGSYLFIWTVAQIVLGACVFLAAHLGCYLFAIMENDRLSPLDIMIKPISIWVATARSLPTTFWRIALVTWGLTAIGCSFIVGGLAHRDLLDWGGQPARMGLVKAISQEAQKQAGDFNSLEEAVEATANQVDVPTTTNPGQPTQPVDCLIIGYEPIGQNDFRTLYLAADVNGRLRFVGTVSQGIPEDARETLNKRMRKLEQKAPFVPCTAPANWLKPKLTCRVMVKEISESNRLVHPVFKSLLNDVSVSVP